MTLSEGGLWILAARPERFEALRDLREVLAGGGGNGGGWLTAIIVVVGVLFALGALASSLALPLFLLRLHQRVKALERRMDALATNQMLNRPAADEAD